MARQIFYERNGGAKNLSPLLAILLLAGCATAPTTVRSPEPMSPEPTALVKATVAADPTEIPTVISAITAAATEGDDGSTPVAGGGLVAFETAIIDLDSPGCGDGGCATLHLEFPQFTAGLPPEDEERLNKQIRDQVTVLAFQDQEEPPEGSLTDQAQGWLDWATAAVEDSGSTGPWTKELKATVLHQAPAYLSLEFPVYSFTGGAHPNGQTKIVSLARPSLRPLALADVLIEGADMAALTAAGEAALRSAREIPAGQSLSEAGYTFPDDQFGFNQNIALSPNGLRFHYDAYEVGPYALGPTTIDIPWSELEGMLRPEYLPAAP